MKTLNSLALCAGISAIFLTPLANADEWNQKTFVTFSEPVEAPGVVLPAGKYVFRLADSPSDRHIVQILNDSETKVFATLLTVPTERITTPDKTIITFSERPSGSPEAIKAWYYPGDKTGEEFVYPKNRAMVLAKSTQQPVKAMPMELAPNITMPTEPHAPIVTLSHVAELQAAPVQIARPKGDDIEVVEIAEVTLPGTASNIPLILALGILAMVGAFGIARYSR
jgi:hypothetical protein